MVQAAYLTASWWGEKQGWEERGEEGESGQRRRKKEGKGKESGRASWWAEKQELGDRARAEGDGDERTASWWAEKQGSGNRGRGEWKSGEEWRGRDEHVRDIGKEKERGERGQEKEGWERRGEEGGGSEMQKKKNDRNRREEKRGGLATGNEGGEAASRRERGVVSEEEMVRLLVAFSLNAFGGVADGRTCGRTSLYLLGSKFSHRCIRPTAVFHGEKGTLAFRSLREVAPGEILTISYLGPW